MRFADIIGNHEAINALRSMVDSNKIPHAILLSGPGGIGKMATARAFAAYINCPDRADGDSCGVCPACRRIADNNNPDLHYVFPIVRRKTLNKLSAADYTEEWNRMLEESPYMDPAKWLELIDAENSQPQIAVEESNVISATASMSAFADKYKIFIIWLPERLGPEAANKLLKLIEEPFEDTLFICVSNDAGSILPTIYSRLRRIDMTRPSDKEVEQALVAKGVSPMAASTYARLADGSLLKAFSLLENAGETDEFFGYFKSAMRDSYSRKGDSLRLLAENLASLGREKSLRPLDYFSRMTRENFRANLCVPPLNVMTTEETEFSTRFAPFINAKNVEAICREIDAARTDISRNANAKLVWFDFLLRLMMLIRGYIPKD